MKTCFILVLFTRGLSYRMRSLTFMTVGLQRFPPWASQAAVGGLQALRLSPGSPCFHGRLLQEVYWIVLGLSRATNWHHGWAVWSVLPQAWIVRLNLLWVADEFGFATLRQMLLNEARILFRDIITSRGFLKKKFIFLHGNTQIHTQNISGQGIHMIQHAENPQLEKNVITSCADCESHQIHRRKRRRRK